MKLDKISEIIKLTSIEYCEEYECTTWDINNGLCEDFANDVIDKLKETSDNIYVLDGGMFFAHVDPEYAKENWGDVIETEYGMWSKDLLEYYGYPPNIDLNIINNDLAHCWVYYYGKHFDAEEPNGVDNWFDLPLCKKFFSKFKNT